MTQPTKPEIASGIRPSVQHLIDVWLDAERNHQNYSISPQQRIEACEEILKSSINSAELSCILRYVRMEKNL